MEQGLNRVFRRLGLLYPPDDILAAYRGVTSHIPKLRGNAVEYLENALQTDHRALVLPLVEQANDALPEFVASRYGLRPMATRSRSRRSCRERRVAPHRRPLRGRRPA